MDSVKGSLKENEVSEVATHLNDVRFLRILQNSENLMNTLREFNIISRRKFGELVGNIPLEDDGMEKEEPSAWVEKVLRQQDLMYKEISELYQWLDSL